MFTTAPFDGPVLTGTRSFYASEEGGNKPHAGAIEHRWMERCGIDECDFVWLRRQSARNGTSVAEEMIAHGLCTELSLALAIAHALGIPFEDVPADTTIVRDAHAAPFCGDRHLLGTDPNGRTHFHMAPPLEHLDAVLEALPKTRRELAMVRIATPSRIRDVRARETASERSERARLSLAADHDALSARRVMTGWQASFLTLFVFVSVTMMVTNSSLFWTGIHVAASAMAFVYTAFRCLVLAETGPRISDQTTEDVPPRDHGPLPVYTVLVALHREAEVVPDLVQAMTELDWPLSKLEVLFVCEATDPITIEALDIAIAGRPNFHVVATPASYPTTKPKALNFALPLARGDFIVLYDAEDRPHPGQLREAYASFRKGGANLACVQAPLAVVNGGQGWRCAHFALEYAVLFRAVLPWLAARKLPVPLGGTSNHFRREILADIGGWDSHNVAEDADLGVRLARSGYDIGTIQLPTWESSTIRWKDWRNQRTRWMKGWLQTWLVHNRDVPRLVRDLGMRRFAVFQLIFAGMFLASFAHLAFIAYVAFALGRVTMGLPLEIGTGVLAAVDLFNICAAYLVFGSTAAKVLHRRERRLLRSLPSLWFYWLTVSYTGMRAIAQLCRQPHKWEKTPHVRTSREAPSS